MHVIFVWLIPNIKLISPIIMKVHALLLFFLAICKVSTVQYAPTWQTSPYIDAGQYGIISTLTGSASTPNY